MDEHLIPLIISIVAILIGIGLLVTWIIVFAEQYHPSVDSPKKKSIGEWIVLVSAIVFTLLGTGLMIYSIFWIVRDRRIIMVESGDKPAKTPRWWDRVSKIVQGIEQKKAAREKQETDSGVVDPDYNNWVFQNALNDYGNSFKTVPATGYVKEDESM